MGHHGVYVWTSYGVFAVIVLWNVLTPLRQHRRWLQEQAQRSRRSQKEIS